MKAVTKTCKVEIQRALRVNRSPAERVELLEALARIEPENLSLQLRLGRERYRSGQADGFEDHLTSCLSLAEQLPEREVPPVGDLLLSVHFSPNHSLVQERLRRIQRLLQRKLQSSDNAILLHVGLSRTLLALRDRDEYISAVANLPSDGACKELEEQGQLKQQISLLRDVGCRWAVPTYPDYNAPKIFGIGLSRTGTTSLHTALGQLGFTNIHWLNKLTCDLIRPSDYFLYDAFTDTGITAQFENLFTMFPNARFVWTMRSRVDWQRSVSRHYYRNVGAVEPNHLIRPHLAALFGGLLGQVHASSYGHHDSWREAYEAHERRIEGFFADKDPSKLLRMSITDGEGWGPLCKFLGSPLPDKSFPHKNTGTPEVKEKPTRLEADQQIARTRDPSVHRSLEVNANISRDTVNNFRFRHVLIVTYGRSGSTLLQGVLNSIEGMLVRGENDNIFHDLFKFWRHVNYVKRRYGKSLTPDRPWFGAGDLPDSTLLEALRQVARKTLLGKEIDDGRVKCLGFKEIRYAQLGADLEAYLDFLQRLFPKAAIIINTRNLDNVAKSAWWRSRSSTEVKRELLALERRLLSYIEDKPNAYVVAYEDVMTGGETIESLFQFLGVEYDQARVSAVLSVRHSYQPNNIDEKSKLEAIENIKLLERYGRSSEALRCAWEMATRWPKDTEVAVLACKHLTAWEHWAEAQQVLEDLPNESRLNPAVQCQRAAIKRSRQEDRLALQIIDDALEINPNHPKLQSMRFDILVDLGRFSDAESQLSKISEIQPSVSALTRKVKLLKAQFREQEAMALIAECLRGHPEAQNIQIWYCKERLRRIAQGLDHISQWDSVADLMLGKLLLSNPDLLSLQILALQLALLREDEKAVSDRLATIPARWQHPLISSAHTWLAARQGLPIQQVRIMWSEEAATHFVPQLRRPAPGELVAVSGSLQLASPGQIVLFTVVRNECQRIPWFLQYYRELGVEQFVFIDNESTDGTVDLLDGQPDVTLFKTSESYARGRSGVVWLNHLMETLGSQSWNLYVDVDEALVFPECEKRGLRGLVDYLEEKGDEVMAGYMIDMFSEKSELVSQCSDATNYLNDYPLFNNSYTRVPKPKCPYFAVYGGLRSDLGTSRPLTKVPLIRGGRGIKLLASSHSISPAKVSAVTCALLHYKFVGDYGATFARDIAENNRIPACRNRHFAYLSLMSNSGQSSQRFRNETTLRFQSSRTLLDHKLIYATEDFLLR